MQEFFLEQTVSKKPSRRFF